MTNEELLNGSCKGRPLRLAATGERVYFRSARFSPHADAVLAIVADESGGTFAVTGDEVAIEEDEHDEPNCERKYADGVSYHAGQE